MTIPPVRPTGRGIVTDVGHHHGTMVVMAGTARGTIPGIFPGTIHGMILGIMVATMAGILLGAMAGMAPTIVRGATTIAGIHLFIIMVVADINRQLTIASTPIVM